MITSLGGGVITDEALRRAVCELLDRQEILDCLMAYSRGVDRLDKDLIVSAYHPDATDDHGMFVGDREEFADWVVQMHGSTHLSHQHCLFNHTCELDGTVAHTETYYMFVGMNREGPPFLASGGRYVDRFEKRDGRWAIADRVCLRDWAPTAHRPNLADPSTMTAISGKLAPAIKEFMREGPLPSRDRTDPSYSRPLLVDPERLRHSRDLRRGDRGQ